MKTTTFPFSSRTQQAMSESVKEKATREWSYSFFSSRLLKACNIRVPFSVK